jgi:predicted nucleic acid-binding Zn ribbon protein
MARVDWCYREPMIPVSDLMPTVLVDVVRQAPLTTEKVAFAWRRAVGAALDGATTVALRDGVLHVRARDTAWQGEIERSAALIRSRLAALLGAQVVRYIQVGVEPGP